MGKTFRGMVVKILHSYFCRTVVKMPDWQYQDSPPSARSSLTLLYSDLAPCSQIFSEFNRLVGTVGQTMRLSCVYSVYHGYSLIVEHPTNYLEDVSAGF